MRIVDGGVLSAGQPGTRRAMAAFPAAVALTDGSVLASYRIGSNKDSADGTVELRRSVDRGSTWSEPVTPFSTILGGKRGSLRCVYFTLLSERRLMACALWVDRETYPGQSLFNAETEGCLPTAVVVADSFDLGVTWSPWRTVPVTEDIGPPSLTSPVLRFASGKLAVSIESNKPYYDRSTWYQRVVYVSSEDGGQSWSAPHTVSQDPEARIFYWDQRAGVAPDGRVVTYSWTYDHQANAYLNIHRRISRDEGLTWSAPDDLGITDQPSRPAILPDGRVVLAWVDRFRTQSIRVSLAANVEAGFSKESELALYTLEQRRSRDLSGTSDMLADMYLWTYGLPYAEVLPDGEVMVVYYAGDDRSLDARWCRLRLD